MISRSRLVRAPAADAFALLRDFSRLPEYNPAVSVLRARRGPCEPGDTFELVVGRRPPFRVGVSGEVLAVSDGRIELVLRSLVEAHETRYVEEQPEGCLVGWEVSFRVPWYMGGRLTERLMFRQLARAAVELELGGVQAILEGKSGLYDRGA